MHVKGSYPSRPFEGASECRKHKLETKSIDLEARILSWKYKYQIFKPISIFYSSFTNPFKPFHLLFRSLSLTSGLIILFVHDQLLFCFCFLSPLQKAKFNMWGRRAPSENRRNAHDCAYFLIQVFFDIFKFLNIISKQ